MIVANPPDVCQVVEVTTESDEQPLSMSQLYPLQISPVSSYAGKHPGVSFLEMSGRYSIFSSQEAGVTTGEKGAFPGQLAQIQKCLFCCLFCIFNSKICSPVYSFYLGKQLSRSKDGNVSCSL